MKLTCNAIGNPSPTISWFFTRNDRSTPREELHVTFNLGGDERNCISRKSGLYFLAQNGRSLLIICHPSYEMHQGNYSCQAKNFLGKDEKSAVVNIESKCHLIFQHSSCRTMGRLRFTQQPGGQ